MVTQKKRLAFSDQLSAWIVPRPIADSDGFLLDSVKLFRVQEVPPSLRPQNCAKCDGER